MPAPSATVPAETIGIAVPFHAHLGYLAEALTSLQQQFDEHWVAVVVDDASPESGACELVASLADPRISYVRNEVNLGVAGNLDLCLGVTGCDVVSILHADDRLLPGYVGAVRAALASAPAVSCVATMAVVVDAAGGRTDTVADRVKRLLWPRGQRVLLQGDRGLARLTHGQFFYCPAVAYRTRLLPDVRFDTAWCQVMDLDLYTRILMDGGSILLDRSRGYAYRRHAASMTARNTASFVRLHEETVLARRTADEAARRGWRRTRCAARVRWTTRLNGVLSVMANRSAPSDRRRRAWRDITRW